MKHCVINLLLTMITLHSFSQGLPPIFDHVDKDIYKTTVLASYPKNSFLENIVKGDDGALYVTNYVEGKVMRVTTDGEKEDYCKLAGKIAGIAKFRQGEFLIAGWDESGRACVFLVDAERKSSVFALIQGGMFPNGIIALTANSFLIADSQAGCIWILDARSRSVRVWLKHDLLARTSEKSPFLAANGLKVYHGHLYASNSEKQLIVKIPLVGNEPGTPEIYIDKTFVDDFCFDKAGNIYAAANIYNKILKITPSKKVAIIAGIEQGAAGATSVLLSTDKTGKEVLYVPTCGGMGVPPPSGIEEGKILAVMVK